MAEKCNGYEPKRPVFTSWFRHWLDVWLWVNYSNSLNLNEKWGEHDQWTFVDFRLLTKNNFLLERKLPLCARGWGMDRTVPVPIRWEQRPCDLRLASWCSQGNNVKTGSEREHPCCSCRVLTTSSPCKQLGIFLRGQPSLVRAYVPTVILKSSPSILWATWWLSKACLLPLSYWGSVFILFCNQESKLLQMSSWEMVERKHRWSTYHSTQHVSGIFVLTEWVVKPDSDALKDVWFWNLKILLSFMKQTIK